MLSRHVVLVYSWVASRYILRGCITPPKILRAVRPGNLKVKCRSGGSSVGLSLYFPVPCGVSIAVTARNRWCLLVDSLYNFGRPPVGFVLACDYVRLVLRCDVF